MNVLSPVENPCEVFQVMASICPPVVNAISPMCPPCSEAVRERNILTKANSVFSVATGSPSLKMRRVYFFFSGTIKEKPPITALFPRSL